MGHRSSCHPLKVLTFWWTPSNRKSLPNKMNLSHYMISSCSRPICVVDVPLTPFFHPENYFRWYCYSWCFSWFYIFSAISKLAYMETSTYKRTTWWSKRTSPAELKTAFCATGNLLMEAFSDHFSSRSSYDPFGQGQGASMAGKGLWQHEQVSIKSYEISTQKAEISRTSYIYIRGN